jgi:oligoendopeptidase F
MASDFYSQLHRAKSGIHIKPSHAGRLRKKAKVKKGQKLSLAELERLKNSSNPATRRQAVFAINARSWNH